MRKPKEDKGWPTSRGPAGTADVGAPTPQLSSARDYSEIDRMNAEANAFAMELLMPADWIRRDAAGVDVCDEAAIAKLAKRYRVPATVMAMRIGQVMT